MSTVGFIGTGAIAAPMIRALARDGHTVTISERSRAVSSALAKADPRIAVADNQGVVDASEIVLLCLRPAVWREAVEGLQWRNGQSIVSVMAGVTLAEIASACAPVTRVSATIPYEFIEHGNCPLPVIGDPETVEALFGASNPVLPQPDEAALRHYFAASALVSGALGFLEAGADWLAGQTGDADAAEVYVANLISGVLNAMPKDRAGRLATAKAELATPNTLNLQMVEGLAANRAFEGLPTLLDSISRSME